MSEVAIRAVGGIVIMSASCSAGAICGYLFRYIKALKNSRRDSIASRNVSVWLGTSAYMGGFYGGILSLLFGLVGYGIGGHPVWKVIISVLAVIAAAGGFGGVLRM
eukprot:PhF_6_TR22464/c0_g1_i1/m.31856